MTVSMVPAYVAACNAPHCPSMLVLASPLDLGPGWSRLRSNDHFQPDPRESVYMSRNQKLNILTYSERSAGSFGIDLCPEHMTVFAGHIPTTDGRPGSRGGSSLARAGCSCGFSYGYVLASQAEPVWRGHLPAALREYGDRPRPSLAPVLAPNRALVPEAVHVD